jgi:hypothetical protein
VPASWSSAAADSPAAPAAAPWITHFDSATETGHIVGVIGGYQQGGDTASVSYSAYLGTAIRQLYNEAIAG